MTLVLMGSKFGTGQGRREGRGPCGRPPDDRWYGLTDPAGIIPSGRAERAGYDLVLVRRGRPDGRSQRSILILGLSRHWSRSKLGANNDKAAIFHFTQEGAGRI